MKYSKNMWDYITKDEYKSFLKQYAKDNAKNTNLIYHTNSIEEAIVEFEKRLLETFEIYNDGTWFENLSYIREAIVHKSLGLEPRNLYTGGNRTEYLAIWDKLPTIVDLELTDEYYTASWGYDQTNIDIAQRVNKRVFGLDVFLDTKGRYYFVRMKKDEHFAFTCKDKIRYFKRDDNPFETFKRDASQTGRYR